MYHQGWLMVEETPQGLLLRPCVSMPIEFYSEKRITSDYAREEAIRNIRAKRSEWG